MCVKFCIVEILPKWSYCLSTIMCVFKNNLVIVLFMLMKMWHFLLLKLNHSSYIFATCYCSMKKIVFMWRNHDSQLHQFMNTGLGGILNIKDGTLVHWSEAPKERRKLHLIEKLDWFANSLDVNSIRECLESF